MSRKYYDLYRRICHPLNLWAAWQNASRGRRMQEAVAAFEFNLEEELYNLHEELAAQTYQPGGYHNFVIYETKRRLISAAPFRDRVVHHALMNVTNSLFERQYAFDSYANRRGKGTHKALDRCTYFLRRHRYVMHLDVVQFFPSVDHQILHDILARTLADGASMGLVDKILASGAGVQKNEYDMVYFPGDDLLAALRPRGLPIGNLTSQHWANVYLNELDQYAKRELKCRAYLRYVDDVLLFADDRQALHEWRQAIVLSLQRLRLTLHENRAQPRPVESGVPFLGFQVFPDHRRLKPRNGRAFQRRLRGLAKALHAGTVEPRKLRASLIGWLNHAGHGDTWGLRRAVLASAGLSAEIMPDG